MLLKLFAVNQKVKLRHDNRDGQFSAPFSIFQTIVISYESVLVILRFCNINLVGMSGFSLLTSNLKQ